MQVKFVRAGVTFYGEAEEYSPEAKEAAKKGMVIVSDAVLPKRYMVAKGDLTEIPFGNYEKLPTGGFGFNDELNQFVEAAFKKAQEISDSHPDDGVLRVGDLFSIGVADGSAWYVVTKVNKKTCDVEWRAFCPDRWTDHHFGYGGRFPVADVSRYVRGAKGLAKLFG